MLERSLTQVDVLRVCESVIASYESDRAVPATAWYFIGSYALGEPVDLSDIDLLAIGTGAIRYDGWAERERTRWHGRLELHQHYIGDLAFEPHVRFLAMLPAAVQIAGLDIREQVPELDLAQFQATAYRRFRDGVDQFLTDGELTRYARRSDGWPIFVVDAPDWTGEKVWTHDLVSFLGAGATAVGAVEALVAGSRSSAVANLAGLSGCAAWAEYIGKSLTFLRAENHYRVLEGEAFRGQLDDVCAAVPEFAQFVQQRIDHG